MGYSIIYIMVCAKTGVRSASRNYFELFLECFCCEGYRWQLATLYDAFFIPGNKINTLNFHVVQFDFPSKSSICCLEKSSLSIMPFHHKDKNSQLMWCYQSDVNISHFRNQTFVTSGTVPIIWLRCSATDFALPSSHIKKKTSLQTWMNNGYQNFHVDLEHLFSDQRHFSKL